MILDTHTLRELIFDQLEEVLDPTIDDICLSATENVVELMFNDKTFTITIEEKKE